MPDTLNRIVKLVPAGTGGGSDLTTDYRALTSAWGHLQASNLNHLARENALRTLYTHHGFVGTKSLYLPANRQGSFTTAPAVGDLAWYPSRDGAGGYTGRIALCCGAHWITRYGTENRWPKIILTCRAKAPATYTVGMYFGASPGRTGFPEPSDPFARTTVTSTSYVDVSLEITLEDAATRAETLTGGYGSSASGPHTIMEHATASFVRLWFGAYCSSNDSAQLASVAGISVYLAPP